MLDFTMQAKSVTRQDWFKVTSLVQPLVVFDRFSNSFQIHGTNPWAPACCCGSMRRYSCGLALPCMRCGGMALMLLHFIFSSVHLVGPQRPGLSTTLRPVSPFCGRASVGWDVFQYTSFPMFCSREEMHGARRFLPSARASPKMLRGNADHVCNMCLVGDLGNSGIKMIVS